MNNLIISFVYVSIILTQINGEVDNILDNGLAPAEIIRQMDATQFAPRCTITGKELDLLFILDSSGSLRASDKYEEEVEVIKTILNIAAVQQSATRVALVQYSGTARAEFHFNTYNQRQDMFNAIDNLRPIYGVTKTGRALFESVKELNVSLGMRGPNVRKIAFLLSDGRTSDYPLDYHGGAELRKAGAETFAYGTGQYAAVEELWNITASRVNVFTKPDFDRLQLYFEQFRGEEVCEEVPVCIPGSDKPVDLMFVVDGSTSIKRTEFRRQVNFVHHVLGQVYVHTDAVRVSFIQYANVPKLEFKFDQIRSKEAIKQVIDNIRYNTGTTKTDRALQLATEQIKSDPGVRGATVEKIIIVLTDGHSQNAVYEAARQLKMLNVTVFAVGVGPTDTIDVLELGNITMNTPNRLFTQANLYDFDLEFQKHVSLVCPGSNLTMNQTKPYIRGPIETTCTDNSVTLTVRTRKPFHGKLYMMDNDHSNCAVAGNSKGVELKLTIVGDDCGIKKSFSEENGIGRVNFTGTAMLQFHPQVVTGPDQGIAFSCDHKLETSMQLIGQITLKNPANHCAYTLRQFAPDGCVALDARVGELVHHRWECNNDDRYGMLVRSCSVQSGDSELPLLDERGCSIDSSIFGTPNYFDAKPSLVLKQNPTFSFPHGSSLKYRCTISLCDRTAGQCEGIVPPNCSPDRAKRSFERPLSGSEFENSFIQNIQVETRMINVLSSSTLRHMEKTRYCTGFLR